MEEEKKSGMKIEERRERKKQEEWVVK